MTDAPPSLECKVVSPANFPLDPRYAQTRAPKVVPWYRTLHDRRSPHPTSRNLLDLPDEVLWRVTHFIAEPNKGRYLSPFALVSRECRQLARPHQFSDVSIVRSRLSENLVKYILQEASQRYSHVQPTIGACIRTLHLVLDREYDSESPDPWDMETDDEDDAPETDGGNDKKEWQGLIDKLAQAMECCMPNLDRLYWDHTAGLTVFPQLVPALVSRLRTCPVFQELWLDDYELFSGLEEADGRPVIPDCHFRVRSLGFGCDQDYYPERSGNIELLAETLLRNSASTLESLIWSPGFEGTRGQDNELDRHIISFQNGPIHFPRLRKFWSELDDGNHMSPATLENFLAAPLESFCPSPKICDIMLENGLDRKYPLPGLRTFAIPHVIGMGGRRVENILRLAAEYASKIQELFVYAPEGTKTSLENHVRRENYPNLRSLCFVWPMFGGGNQLLDAIGAHLPTLEELAFNFVIFSQTTHDVPSHGGRIRLSHAKLAKVLSPLKRLTRLAIFGDEYIADYCGPEWSWHHFYKEHVWFNQSRGCLYYTRNGNMTHRAPSRPGDEVEDWNTAWLEVNFIDSDLYSTPSDLAALYAEELPSLRQFVIGRVLVEINRPDSGRDGT
ncbi:uncharacterized protein F5Z01DRAFT_663127 [Emericellopsis atlantica]|uniref:Uncharacterized protein n=1 Tax=Emericellopsis atlantica TaxID=2614577 RepID=A0A9P7ZHI6_9HYPO|nr:uncharacterized protein F5Z01DRAFT_663127 [Emericellopsis atlantica]KAG9251583.1 hypothetical protein F5Z01DRAFT_663127 [Emericellopsis atlantica]